jgi:hypothetical protein
MQAKDILDMHKRIDERSKTRNTEQDDNLLSDLATTASWEVLKSKIENKIADLLEPIDFSLETPLDVRGSLADAKTFAIVMLRQIIAEVETTRTAKQIQKDNQ